MKSHGMCSLLFCVGSWEVKEDVKKAWGYSNPAGAQGRAWGEEALYLLWVGTEARTHRNDFLYLPHSLTFCCISNMADEFLPPDLCPDLSWLEILYF